MAGLMSAFSGDLIVSPKVSNVMIVPLDREAKIDEKMGGAKVLQYWPESLDESKSQNWQSKELPGLNIPLYQWVSGGERQFSFTAQFTRDMDGEINSKLLPKDKHNVDIDAAIAWLYLLSSSDYEAVGDMHVAVAPPVLFLAFMGTKMGYQEEGAFKASGSSAIASRTGGVHCSLTEVRVARKDWFPTGGVRSADVSLSFNEVIQIGQNILPYGRKQYKELAENYTRTDNQDH